MQIFTRWRECQPITRPTTDAERHEAFSAYAVETLRRDMPWLLPLLNGAGVRVYVGQAMFFYQLPSQPGQWVEIPEASGLLSMVPWVEEDETPQ